MNQQEEFSEEIKPLQPSVLKDINKLTDKDEVGAGKPLKGKDNAENTSSPGEFSALDFVERHGLINNAKHFEKVQDLSNNVLNDLRAPFCNADFRPVVVPDSKAKVPSIPKSVYIGNNEHAGNGLVNLSKWYFDNEIAHFAGFLVSGKKFAVKMSAKRMTKILTDLQVWDNAWMDTGVKDSRAKPACCLGYWAALLGPTYSTVERYIRTDVVGHWMYNSYKAGDPAYVHVINAEDLRAYLNTHSGSLPLPVNTLCLALEHVPTASLGKLSMFGQHVIIDFNSSMNTSRGQQTTYNKVTAYRVLLTDVDAGDDDMKDMLCYTYGGEDMQWALLANTLPLTNGTTMGSVFGGNTFRLEVYNNSICDQFVNYYSTHHDFGNCIPYTSALEKSQFVQSWRLFKTALVQRAIVEIGYVGFLGVWQTWGKPLMVRNYIQSISGCFVSGNSAALTPHDTFLYYPMWIPYEMWVENGADLKLDGTDYVDGESTTKVNAIYCVPRSQNRYSLADWDGEDPIPGTFALAYYYTPNERNALTIQLPYMTVKSVVQSVVPATVPRCTSTTDTATLNYVNDQFIPYTKTRKGEILSGVYRKKLVFGRAVQN